MASADPKKDKASTEKESGSKGGPPKPSLNMGELRELADLIDERGFTDFEFENEKIRVRMSKNIAPPVQPMQAVPPVPAVPAAVPQSAPTAEEPKPAEEASEAEADDGLHQIISPIVGTFYRSPGPDKDPFVSEGDKVGEDTTVCIVEAMKLMNEIQAETSGEVVKIYVENGQPVEYGQPLFGIKK